jgi:hypothetical protein
MFRKGELEILWPFYLSVLVYGFFGLVSAYFMVYFLSMGFSIFQISALFAILQFSSIAFDISTGAVADFFDSWDKKYIFTEVYDLQEEYRRNDLEKRVFDYEKG